MYVQGECLYAHHLWSEAAREGHRVSMYKPTVGSAATRANRRRLRLSLQTGGLAFAKPPDSDPPPCRCHDRANPGSDLPAVTSTTSSIRPDKSAAIVGALQRWSRWALWPAPSTIAAVLRRGWPVGVNFDLNDLQAFRAVVLLGGFRKAVEAVSLWPALSRPFDKLEHAIRVRHFERALSSERSMSAGYQWTRAKARNCPKAQQPRGCLAPRR
ncbi:hypothetical protein OKW43_008483 [Paraburkholderia sp. WC7.3g]